MTINKACVSFQSGKTALHAAAEHGHVKVVELLLSTNADVNAETTVSTPAHIQNRQSL